VIVGLAGGVALIAVSIGAYYLISYAVLYAVGKVFPLTGRRR
jgi:hypothetical protein